MVGEDGNVVPGEVAGGGGDGIAIINTMSGASPLVIPDSAERANKGFGLIGNTEQSQDPQPSPDNPQEIKNVGKWNEESQKYEVSVRVTGKNILNTKIEPDIKGVYQGWKVGDGKTDITLSIIDKENNADISECYFGLSGNGINADQGVAWCVENGNIIHIKMTSLHPYVTIFPSDETALRKILGRFDIQCEFGKTQTEYQPYKEQTFTLTADRPITKWDKLVEQDGQIGWLYGTDMSYQNITESDIEANDIKESFGRYYVNAIKGKRYSELVCNISPYTKYMENGACGFWWSDTLCMKVSNTYTGNNGTEDIVTAIDNFKKNILSKGITVYFQKEIAEFVPLPQSEQEAIRALSTYYPTTVITADGGEVIPSVELTYTADTKSYVDSKIAALSKAML